MQVEGGADLLAHVELVAVLDGVGHGFAHRHADPVRSVLVQPCVFAEMFRDHLHELDVLESAADGDLDPLAVTVLHRWKPRAFYGTLARACNDGMGRWRARFPSACPAA